MGHYFLIDRIYVHRYITPNIRGISPGTVVAGTMLTVSGSFYKSPFAPNEVQSPRMEVPLASVKVANRDLNQQRPENEPFGQSGTRCGLFDPTTELPYRVESGGDQVTSFSCMISGPREAGRYNLSVALLGQAMSPAWAMNMGESVVDPFLYHADHHGRSFMLEHVAVIADYSPRAAGLTGGVILTVVGDSLSANAKAVTVEVGGVACDVLTASMQRITCRLQAYR